MRWTSIAILTLLLGLAPACQGEGGNIGDDDDASPGDDDDATPSDDDDATPGDDDDATPGDDDTTPGDDDDTTEVPSLWFEDADGDEYGNDDATLEQVGQPDGYVDEGGDCDDGDAEIHPGADEGCNGVDNDCDGSPAADEVDDDADGVMVCADDCDDADPDIFPGAEEACDLVDNDCDGDLDSADACGCDIDTYDGHQYLLCHAATHTWEDARTYCTDRGHDLTGVADELESTWLFDTVEALVPDTYADGEPHWWIGLNDIAAGGYWEWANGEVSFYAGWGEGEPEDMPGWEEDCVVLIQGGVLGWADASCELASEFVCESP